MTSQDISSNGTILTTGGPAVLLWGWIITTVFSVLTALVMAEICSTYPAAGSVYQWSGSLAPPKWGPVSAFIAGSFNFLGNIAGTTSFAFSSAEFLNAVLEIDGQGVSSEYQVAISILFMIYIGVMNALRVDHLGTFQNGVAVFAVVATVVVVVSLFILPKERQSHEFVWTSTYNATGFSQSWMWYVCLNGLASISFVFTGYDSAAHMAEETENASQSVSRSMPGACLAGGITGFLFILSLLYATTDIDKALSSKNAAIAVINDAAGPTAAKALGVLILINNLSSGPGAGMVGIRIGYAMFRDHAFPYSPYFKKVHPTLQVPLRVLVLIVFLGILLLLLPLFEELALSAILSITVVGFLISYAIPILQRITVAKTTFRRTSFHLGPFSLPLGWLCFLWLTSISVIVCWPQIRPVTAKNMNYTVVIVGISTVLGALYWYTCARGVYAGPKLVPIEWEEAEVTWQHHLPHHHSGVVEEDKADDAVVVG